MVGLGAIVGVASRCAVIPTPAEEVGVALAVLAGAGVDNATGISVGAEVDVV